MVPEHQRAKAARFKQLHRGRNILVLPNAWDVASARVLEAVGFPAIGTTSAGIAASMGFRDGEELTRIEMLVRVGEIADAVMIPVTADMEAGYGETVDDIAVTALAVCSAGAVGLNIEDRLPGQKKKLNDIEFQTAAIQAIREVGDDQGLHLVINARTDAFALPLSERERMAVALERARRFHEAGADCVFVPFVTDREVIAELVRETGAPLNILAAPGTPPIEELARLGVARVSTGSGLIRATLGVLRRIAEALRSGHDYGCMFEYAIDYSDLLLLFPARMPDFEGK